MKSAVPSRVLVTAWVALAVAAALGCAAKRQERGVGLIADDYVVTRPAAVAANRTESDESLRLFRHYFSLSGIGGRARFFLATWEHIEPNHADFAVTESNSGEIRVKGVRGGFGGLVSPLPRALVRNPTGTERYVEAIRDFVKAQEPDARNIEVAYQGIYREIYLHEEIPLSLKRDGCALAHRASLILALPDGREGAALTSDLRVTSWSGGSGCSYQRGPRLYLPFTVDTTDGQRKLPALLDEPSPARDQLMRALAEGIDRLRGGRPGVDPGTLYPEATLLPSSLAQELRFWVSLPHHASRAVTLPVRDAVLSAAERSDTLLFLGVPVQLTVRVRSDLQDPSPDENGWTSFHLIVDWTLEDQQGGRRTRRMVAEANAVVDASRVGLIDVRSREELQPLPSRYPTLIERLTFGVSKP